MWLAVTLPRSSGWSRRISRRDSSSVDASLVSASSRPVSDEEIERIVAKRLKERQEVVAEIAAAIKPELARMSKEISDANHIKRTLGRQIANLERMVLKTNIAIDTHAQLAWHAGTTGILDRLTKSVEVVGELGVDALSQEQRKALPAVLEGYVRTREERKEEDGAEKRRQAWLQAVGAAGGALAGAIAAFIALIAYLSTHPPGGHP